MPVIIYRIVFPNGKNYVGQTRTRLEKRMNSHKFNSKNNYSEKYYLPLYNAIRKYKWNSLQIEVLEITDIKTANRKETFYMEKFSSLIEENGYNCVKERSGGGYIMSEKTRKTKSLAWKNSKDCKENLAKLQKSNIGRKASDEAKKNMSLAHDGKKCACFDLNENKLKEYRCIGAVKKDGHSRSHVSACCNNKQRTHHNLTWKFI